MINTILVGIGATLAVACTGAIWGGFTGGLACGIAFILYGFQGTLEDKK